MRVVTIGTFDLLHEGHQRLLSFCHNLAQGDDEFLVGVNSGDSPALNGKRPTQDDVTRHRAVMRYVGDDHGWLYDIGVVNHVVVNHGRGAELLQDGDLVVVGSEYARGDYPAQLGTTWDALDAMNVSILFRPRTLGISSTQLREAHEPAPET